MVQPARGARRSLLLAAIGVVVAGAALAAVLDWREVRSAMGRADWELAAAALACTFASVAAISAGYAVIASCFGKGIPFRRLLHVGFVSGAVTNMTSLGGMGGIIVRVAAMERMGLGVSDTLAASAVHSYLTNLAMWLLVPIGLGHIASSRDYAGGEIGSLATLTFLLTAVAVCSAVLLFSRRWRVAAIGVTARAIRRIARRDAESALTRFSDSLDRGLGELRRKRWALPVVASAVILDWSAVGAAVWLSYDAFGQPLHFGVLLTGLGIGIGAGVISMVPGGLGVQEASLAGVYTLFGVPFDQAVLGALLFRFIYDVVPFLVALPLMWPLMRAGPTGTIDSDRRRDRG